MYAERAHSDKVEIEGASHAVYVSHPKEVAAMIEEAAGQATIAGSHSFTTGSPQLATKLPVERAMSSSVNLDSADGFELLPVSGKRTLDLPRLTALTQLVHPEP